MKKWFLYLNRRSSEHFVLLSNKVLKSRNLVSDPRIRHWPNVVSSIYMYQFKYVTWHNHDTFFKITVSSRVKGMDTLIGEVTLKFVLLPFFKGVYSKRKVFASKGEQMLSFSSRPLSRRDLQSTTGSHKNVSLVQSNGRNAIRPSSPLSRVCCDSLWKHAYSNI